MRQQEWRGGLDHLWGGGRVRLPNYGLMAAKLELGVADERLDGLRIVAFPRHAAADGEDRFADELAVPVDRALDEHETQGRTRQASDKIAWFHPIRAIKT